MAKATNGASWEVRRLAEEEVIPTNRLTIRPFTAGDAADLHEYPSDPAIDEFEPGEPSEFDRAAQIAQERARAADFWAMECTRVRPTRRLRRT